MIIINDKSVKKEVKLVFGGMTNGKLKYNKFTKFLNFFYFWTVSQKYFGTTKVILIKFWNS